MSDPVEPTEGAVPAPAASEQPKEVPKPADPDSGFKSPESKDAVLADLQKERELRKTLQGDVAERTTQVQALTDSLSEKDVAISERDAQLVAKDSEISVLRLALSKGLSSQDDIDILTAVTDEAKRTALADRLAKQAASSGVVHKSGTGSGENKTLGGSVSAGREAFAAKKK